MVAIVVVAGTVVGGMVVAGDTGPTGEAVLEDAGERYQAAENVAGAANVTVDPGTGNAARSAEVVFALTADGESRVGVTVSNRTVVAGSNGSAGWVHLEEVGLTRVVNLSDGSGEWTTTDTASPLDAGVGASGLATAALRERFEELVPVEKLNTSRRARLSNLTDGGHDLNLTDGGYAEYTAEGWNETDLWNRSAMGLMWSQTSENVSAERLGTETIDGTEAHIIEVENPDDREGTLRIWVGTEDATILKTQLTAADLTITVRYTDVRFDTSIDDSTFRPPGAGPTENGIVDSRDELQAATAFDVPVLSDAYTFTTGSTVTYGGVTAAIGSYTGPGNVTVVATTASTLPVDGASAATGANATEINLSGVTATVADTDSGVIVSWEADGVRNAVISEDSRAVAVSAAESIVDRG